MARSVDEKKIMETIGEFVYEDRLRLLAFFVKEGVYTSASSDGTRVNLSNINDDQLKGLQTLIAQIKADVLKHHSF
jgi:hypothetical protein